jgi:hypothetical protein
MPGPQKKPSSIQWSGKGLYGTLSAFTPSTGAVYCDQDYGHYYLTDSFTGHHVTRN